MKKTFYEVLWDLCEKNGLVDEWKAEGLLIHKDSRMTWHPRVAEILGTDDLSVVGGIADSTPKVAAKPKEPEVDISWIKEYMIKFSAKNLGVTAKTTDLATVQTKMTKFIQKYKYTKEEILGATDLYIDTLRRKGSLNYIRECGYFIFKRIDGIDQSDLANWCEQFKDNGNQSTNYNSRNII
jgi:hypothetical protein